MAQYPGIVALSSLSHACQGRAVVGALVYNTHWYASQSLFVGAPQGRDPGLSRLQSRSYCKLHDPAGLLP